MKLNSVVAQMYDAGLLARIIVDEAHCCSSLGQYGISPRALLLSFKLTAVLSQ